MGLGEVSWALEADTQGPRAALKSSKRPKRSHGKPSFDKEVEKPEPWYSIGGSVKWRSRYGMSTVLPQKN